MKTNEEEDSRHIFRGELACVPPRLPKQSEHAHPASQAAHQKKQALPLS